VTGERGPLVTVARFLSPIEAEFARSRLEADGIGSFIQGEGLASILPATPFTEMLLQVRAADEARAREILGEEPPAAPVA